MVLGEDDKPGHELVELLLVLLVLGGDGVLGLLLHPLHKVLHVLEGIDLEGHRSKKQQQVRTKSFSKRCSFRTF